MDVLVALTICFVGTASIGFVVFKNSIKSFAFLGTLLFIIAVLASFVVYTAFGVPFALAAKSVLEGHIVMLIGCFAERIKRAAGK